MHAGSILDSQRGVHIWRFCLEHLLLEFMDENGDTSQDIDKSSDELSWPLLLLLRFGWSYLYSGHSVGHVPGDP